MKRFHFYKNLFETSEWFIIQSLFLTTQDRNNILAHWYYSSHAWILTQVLYFVIIHSCSVSSLFAYEQRLCQALDATPHQVSDKERKFLLFSYSNFDSILYMCSDMERNLDIDFCDDWMIKKSTLYIFLSSLLWNF